MEGNIIIHKENVPFEMVAKTLINDDGIDALTLGIYVKILGFNKEKWNLNITGLAAKLNLSVPKIKAAFALLERTGYLRRVHIKNESGHYTGYDYHIGNVPFPEELRTNVVADCSSDTKNQQLEKPAAGKTSSWKNQPLECPAAGKSDGIIIDTKSNNIPQEKQYTISNNFPPTPQAVAEYVRSRGFRDPEGFADYFLEICTNSGWKRANGKGEPIANWKNYIVSSWEQHHKNKTYPRAVRQANAKQVTMDEFKDFLR